MLYFGNKKIRHYFILLLLVFFFSSTQGYFFSIQNKDEADEIINELFSGLGFFGEFSPIWIFVLIFLNNTLKAFLMVLLGFFFGIVPFVMVIFNGTILGAVIYVAGSELAFGEIIWSLLPHGIVEIPAFILSGAYGAWLGEKFFHKIKHNEEFLPYFSFSMKKFGKRIVILFLLAAFIEAFITPLILEFFQ